MTSSSEKAPLSSDQRVGPRQDRMVTAHSIAHWIMWQQAQELSKAVRGRQSPDWFYDPLAATCLGDLLYDRLMREAEVMTKEEKIIVAVSGGRDYTDAAKVNEVLRALHSKHGIEMVIEGGCPVKRNGGGADGLSRKWAEVNEVNCLTIPPKSKIFGWPSCGPIRNAEIAQCKPDLWVLFPGGKGTLSAASEAERAGITVMKVGYDD